MGLTDEEKVNQALRDRSLVDYLANPDDAELAPLALKNKGRMLFMQLEARLGEERFDQLLNRLTRGYPYKAVPLDSVVLALQNQGIDLERLMTQWAGGDGAPLLPLHEFSGLPGP